MPEPEALKEALRADLLTDFKPAFLGRVNVLPYLPLGKDVLNEIAKIKLNKVSKRINEKYSAVLEFDEQLIDYIVEESNDAGSGARIVQTIIENTLLPKISHEILNSFLIGKEFNKINVNGSIKSPDIYIS